MNVNRVFMAGRLVRDPELRLLTSGTSVCSFSIAVNRKWGEKEETTFLDCEAWKKQAELVAAHLHKGDPIFVEGRLKQDEWTTQDGQKRSKLKVVVENFEFIGGKSEPAPAREGSAQQEPAIPSIAAKLNVAQTSDEFPF